MTITCDTEISELLNIADVESILSSMNTTSKTYSTELETIIDKEINEGAFSTDIFNIDGSNLLHAKGLNLLASILQTSTEFDTYRNLTIKNTKEQRKKELTELKRKLEEKIREYDAEISKINIQINNVKFDPLNITKYYLDIAIYKSNIKNIEKQKTPYEDKLGIVIVELGVVS